MKYAHAIRTLALTIACLAHAQYIPEIGMHGDAAEETEVMRRARLAGQNNDRSEMPFLEEATIKESTREIDRQRAARAYIKIATLDESVGFMRKLYAIEGSTDWWLSVYLRFLEKAAAEEKNAEDGARENIYAFLLEVMQACESAVDANRADLFLLERVPGYADSKQRAALTRYANTGNNWVTNTFNPIKAHFDAIPPSKRVDLRNRFPGLPPPPEDPPKPSNPYLWPVIAAAILAIIAVALAIRKVRKGKQ